MRQETTTFLCANSGFPPETLGCNRDLGFNCLFLGSALGLGGNFILTPKHSGFALS